MIRKTLTGLFPLRLPPFEEFMLTDDRPDYPMTFCLDVGLSGSLCRQSFEQALQQALERHPLLTSCVETRWTGACWVDSQLVPKIQWSQGDPQLPPLRARFLDLRRTAGLQIWAGVTEDRARIVFQFHHAATDGVGAIQFIGDLLASYGQFTSENPQQAPELGPLETDRLLQRGQLWEPDHRPRGLWSRLAKWAWELAPVIPTDLAACREGSLSAPSSLQNSHTVTDVVGPFITRILNPEQVLSIKASAAAQGCTTNDLYTLAMFQTLERWNRLCGRVTSREAYRVGLPVTLRTPRHEDSPAANILSYMFLTRRGSDMHDLHQMLRYIHETSQNVLISGESGLTPWIMGGMRRIPGLYKLASRAPIRFCTAMFANVGDIRRNFRSQFILNEGRCVAGNMILEHLLGAAPIRPGTRLGLSLGTYAKKLYINLNCDPRRYTSEDANRLADLFVSSVLELVQSGSEGDSSRAHGHSSVVENP